MGIEHHWQTPTSAPVQIDEVLPSVTLGAYGFSDDGQLGAVAHAHVSVDDPDDGYDLEVWQRYYARETNGPAELVLTGAVAKSATSLTLTGTATAFLTELAPGDEVIVPGGGGTDYLWIAAVADDTHATVYYVPAHSASGQTATRAAQQRLFTGWSAPNVVQGGGESLGDEGSESIEAGSVWEVDLAEANTALHLRMCRDATWTKAGAAGSATTVGGRLTALLAAPEASLIFDDGLVTYSTTPVDADNLQGRYLDEQLNALSQVDRRNHSLDYHEATGHLELIFRKPNTNVRATPAKISDVLGDAGALVFPTLGRAVLTRQGDMIAAGVQVTGARKNYYRTNAATADAFEYRDISAPNSGLKNATSANAYGDAILGDSAGPDEKVTCAIKVPSSQVHLFRRLRCLQVRFVHLNGWAIWRWAQILRRDVTHYAEGSKRAWGTYKVDLVLGPVDPPPPPPEYSFAELVSATYYDASGHPTGGSKLVQWMADGDAPGTGWATHPKVGLVDYDTTGAHSPGVYTGLKSTGTGVLDVVAARINWNFVWSGSGRSMEIQLKKNGTTIATTTVNDPHVGGLHGWVSGGSVSIAGESVAPGDIFTVVCDWSGSDPLDGAIFGAVGSPFSVTGALS